MQAGMRDALAILQRRMTWAEGSGQGKSQDGDALWRELPGLSGNCGKTGKAETAGTGMEKIEGAGMEAEEAAGTGKTQAAEAEESWAGRRQRECFGSCAGEYSRKIGGG